MKKRQQFFHRYNVAFHLEFTYITHMGCMCTFWYFYNFCFLWTRWTQFHPEFFMCAGNIQTKNVEYFRSRSFKLQMTLESEISPNTVILFPKQSKNIYSTLFCNHNLSKYWQFHFLQPFVFTSQHIVSSIFQISGLQAELLTCPLFSSLPQRRQDPRQVFSGGTSEETLPRGQWRLHRQRWSPQHSSLCGRKHSAL